MKKLVLLDVDDTLIDFVGPLVPFVHQNYPDLIENYEARYGKKFTRESFSTYYLRSVLGCSPDIERRIINEFYESTHFDNLPPMQGVISALEDLARAGCRLAIATSRPEDVREKTLDLLKRTFSVRFEEIYFASGQIVSSASQTKGKICRSIGAHFFVDDHHRHMESCLEHGNGTKPVLLRAPWNLEYDNPGILSAETWPAITEILLSSQHTT